MIQQKESGSIIGSSRRDIVISHLRVSVPDCGPCVQSSSSLCILAASPPAHNKTLHQHPPIGPGHFDLWWLFLLPGHLYKDKNSVLLGVARSEQYPRRRLFWCVCQARQQPITGGRRSRIYYVRVFFLLCLFFLSSSPLLFLLLHGFLHTRPSYIRGPLKGGVYVL